eukprot:14759677-Alexandrium_andersonii.AAC.1
MQDRSTLVLLRTGLRPDLHSILPSTTLNARLDLQNGETAKDGLRRAASETAEYQVRRVPGHRVRDPIGDRLHH